MLLFTALLLAQTAPCAVMDVNLPTPLAAWTRPALLVKRGESGAAFAAGQPVSLGAMTGGDIVFTVAKPGTWGIALDQKGWIELFPAAEGSEALASVSHAHGPECSTIAKIVRYDLKPGTYRVDFTRMPNPTAKTMLVAP